MSACMSEGEATLEVEASASSWRISLVKGMSASEMPRSCARVAGFLSFGRGSLTTGVGQRKGGERKKERENGRVKGVARCDSVSVHGKTNKKGASKPFIRMRASRSVRYAQEYAGVS